MLAYAEVTHDELDELLADDLLESWYDITSRSKLKVGYQRVSPYCRRFMSSRQYDEASLLTNQSITKEQYVRVDLCVDMLSLAQRAAIGIEMKNRLAKARVWRCATASTYREALESIVPMMRKKGLFD